MSAIRIRMEGFAGANIEHVADEMIAFANLTKVTVMLKFNDVDLMACPGDSPTALVNAFHEQGESNYSYKLARGSRA